MKLQKKFLAIKNLSVNDTIQNKIVGLNGLRSEGVKNQYYDYGFAVRESDNDSHLDSLPYKFHTMSKPRLAGKKTAVYRIGIMILVLQSENLTKMVTHHDQCLFCLLPGLPPPWQLSPHVSFVSPPLGLEDEPHGPYDVP